MLLFSKGTLALSLSLAALVAPSTARLLDGENVSSSPVQEEGGVTQVVVPDTAIRYGFFKYKCFNETYIDPPSGFMCKTGIGKREPFDCKDNMILWKTLCPFPKKRITPYPAVKVGKESSSKFLCFSLPDNWEELDWENADWTIPPFAPTKDDVCTNGRTHSDNACGDCGDEQMCFRADDCA